MSTPVGLLLVHGIGRQQRGETLDGFLGGLRLAYGARLTVDRRDADCAVLDGLNRPVHVFEVYWADLLHGEDVEGTFDVNRIHETVWFPWLNYRQSALDGARSTRLFVLARTLVLAMLGVLLATGLVGAQMIASIVEGAVATWRESRTRRRTPARWGTIWSRVRRQDADHRRRTALDDVLDQIVGDIFNYVHGIAHAFPADTATNRKLAEHVAQIRPRFVRAAERARDAGCAELQVLAHSLGTVVAFLGMCPDTPTGPAPSGAVRITRFHTIGSPLEKVRFFWTRLVRHTAYGPAIVAESGALAVGRSSTHTMQWDNFFSRFDLVSGALGAFAGWPTPVNHAAAGLGGFVTAHIAYNRNPEFLAFVGEVLTGERPRIVVPLGRRVLSRLQTVAECLVLPAILAGLSVLGFVILVGFAGAVGWAVSRPVEWAGLPLVATLVRLYIPSSIFFVMTAGAVLIGHSSARQLYKRFWA
ncbi:MAG: hypothetical protein OEW19_01190 [Acidobacteriota bacterium]|nr:hypothetical protein [Acidobacteriota bacterium]